MLPIDIGHKTYLGLMDPDAAFWSLVAKGSLDEALASGGAFMKKFLR
jgi:uncharacterized protein